MAYKIKTPVPVIESGTGVTTLTTAYAPVCAGTTATGALQVASTGLATSGFVLTSNGSAALPSFKAAAGGITTVNGDSGSITGSTVTLTGGSSGAVFAGSGATMTESFNYLSLPATTSTDGQIKISGSPVLSMPVNISNIIVGASAGNFTMSAGGTAALGQSALAALTSGSYNTGIGYLSLNKMTSGTQNVAVGGNSMINATTDNNNTGVGVLALNGLAGGTGGNTALGYGCGSLVTTGNFNTSIGYNSMSAGAGTSGSYNIGIGYQGAFQITSGQYNVAIGYNSLSSLPAGSYNIGIGYTGGSSLTTTDSSNIDINNTGVAGESNTLRIGAGTGTGTQQLNKSFIHGIRGITTDDTDRQVMFVDANGQIGTNDPVYMSAHGTGCIFVGGQSGNASESGTGNVGLGQLSLTAHTSGNFSVAVGYGALEASVADSFNVCIGTGSGAAINGSYGNTAVGHASLFTNVTSGFYNNAFGYESLYYLNGGVNNTCLGTASGINYNAAESSNLIINHPGVTGESNVCRLGAGTGTSPQQLSKTFISGIQGVTVTGSPVLVSSSDQLGVAVSSKRFKDNISDMGSYSSDILKLRPTTFNYTVGEDHSLQGGLIAEEVQEIMSQLVVLDKEGLAQTVKYHDLPALLLNELQKAVKRIEALESKLSSYECKG